MPRVERIESVRRKLKALQKNGETKSVIVGYTANYALYVHERTDIPHKVGQAKFLEQPARENRDEYGSIVRRAVEKGATLQQALLLAGLRLQRDSQKLVPVDTGNLKNSAFTRLE